VESYIFRRYICGIPAAGLNRIFATLHRDIKNNNLLVGLGYALLDKNTHRRFPSDEEFTAQFQIKDIYNASNRYYILEKLETYCRGKKTAIPLNSIEHIMPQKLTDSFKKDLGLNWEELHKKYLHTIGNLTLIENNSELNDKPFIKKRNDGYRKSSFKLSRMLANCYFWDEEKILERANLLAKRALKIWRSPILNTIEPKPPMIEALIKTK
jgi:sulfur relay (sulfurtransferase) DsrF/TusC family protein